MKNKTYKITNKSTDTMVIENTNRQSLAGMSIIIMALALLLISLIFQTYHYKYAFINGSQMLSNLIVIIIACIGTFWFFKYMSKTIKKVVLNRKTNTLSVFYRGFIKETGQESSLKSLCKTETTERIINIPKTRFYNYEYSLNFLNNDNQILFSLIEAYKMHTKEAERHNLKDISTEINRFLTAKSNETTENVH